MMVRSCTFMITVTCFSVSVSYFGRIIVPYPFQWGAPTFDAGEAFAMMAASFVALVEVVTSALLLNVMTTSDARLDN